MVFFANEFEKLLRKGSAFPQPVRIELTSEKLAAAIEEVLAFCKYIDEHLPRRSFRKSRSNISNAAPV